MNDSLAYFLSWHTYGTWLPGQAPGSVDRAHNTYGEPCAPADPERHRRAAGRMKPPPLYLDEAMRTAVQAAIDETCTYRGWSLFVLHMRTTHVHAVVSAQADKDKVLDDFKAYATRRLRREQLTAADVRPWSQGGSKKIVWVLEQLVAVADYVVNGQGTPLLPLPIDRRARLGIPRPAQSLADAHGPNLPPS